MKVRQSTDWPRFEAQPDLLLLLDLLGQRYGRLPSELLELDAWELGLAIACAQQRESTSAQLMRRLNAEGMPVFPVVVLMG